MSNETLERRSEMRVRVLSAGVSLPDLMMREGIHPETPSLAVWATLVRKTPAHPDFARRSCGAGHPRLKAPLRLARHAPPCSGQELGDDAGPGHIGVGQTVVAAVVGVGEAPVVEAQGMQEGGLEVVDRDHVLHGPV